jgi:voltage-gated potassium channel
MVAALFNHIFWGRLQVLRPQLQKSFNWHFFPFIFEYMASQPFRPFRKVYRAIMLFTAALVTGTLGYMIIEHYTLLDAVYMTVITLSTVGYGEVHPLSEAGRVFTILLIVFDLFVFAYTIALISSYFLEGEFSEEYKLYNMKKSINDLSGHIIICGFGRNGREAARALRESGRDYVIIETAELKHESDLATFKYYLQDDATRDDVLVQAGIERASALITALPDDADNVFVVLTARELNPGIKIISRASHGSSVRKLKTAGANNVIMPDTLGGTHMAGMILNPDIKEFVDLLSTQNTGEFSIQEIECNKPLGLDALNAWLKTGATILGIKTATGEYKLNPAPGTQVSKGERLIAMGSKEQLEKLNGLV